MNLYSNRTDNWQTPTDIFNYFSSKGYIDFNPLSDKFSNSLLKEFDSYFCNPPFSNIEPFVDYMLKSSCKFKCVMLLPIRLNTNWFQKLVRSGRCSIFVLGRLHYLDKLGFDRGAAPFDSMLVLLDNSFHNLELGFLRKFKDFDSCKCIQLSINDFLIDSN